MSEQTKLAKLKQEYEAHREESKRVGKEVEEHPDDVEMRRQQIALLELCNKKL